MTVARPLRVVAMEVGPLAENTYIVGHVASGKAAVIDPGDEADEILSQLSTRGWVLDKILLTHGHFDHVGAVAALKDRTGASVHIHPDDVDQMRTAGRHAGRQRVQGVPRHRRADRAAGRRGHLGVHRPRRPHGRGARPR